MIYLIYYALTPYYGITLHKHFLYFFLYDFIPCRIYMFGDIKILFPAESNNSQMFYYYFSFMYYLCFIESRFTFFSLYIILLFVLFAYN